MLAMAGFKPLGGVRVSRGDLWWVAIGVLVPALWLIELVARPKGGNGRSYRG
ncbi:hypothetical protein [Streptomyces roseus]|uniref:hypothetical protein n=1 Tax=Streptomyces roseus TaxID=66430 RepID=UPI00131C8134|nr:hypothetical protein [Streptomyces roseus]